MRVQITIYFKKFHSVVINAFIRKRCGCWQHDRNSGIVLFASVSLHSSMCGNKRTSAKKKTNQISIGSVTTCGLECDLCRIQIPLFHMQKYFVSYINTYYTWVFYTVYVVTPSPTHSNCGILDAVSILL